MHSAQCGVFMEEAFDGFLCTVDLREKSFSVCCSNLKVGSLQVMQGSQ